MKRFALLFVFATLSLAVSAQPPELGAQPPELGAQPPELGAEGVAEKPHARKPKEIAFQNDSQWEDNRWQQTDVGPFLAGSITCGNVSSLKGLAIHVGDDGQAAVCFDTARMRMVAGWTDGFLQFEARRFGLIRPPAAAGQNFFSTSELAGWDNDNRFQPELGEITDPETDASYGVVGQSETRLPKQWARYRGHYTSGDRVVLSYTVAGMEVLESPWFVRADAGGGSAGGNSAGGPKVEAFVRWLTVSPSATTHRMLVADSDCQVEVIGGPEVSVERRGKRTVLVIPPHTETQSVKMLIMRPQIGQASIDALRALAGQPTDLSQLIQKDAGRFPQPLVTQGTTSGDGGPYVIDTITLPFENPWNALFFTAGHDFFSDGSAAICTVHGDVWTVNGIDQDLGQLTWRRYATGLHQPLGLRIIDDKVYVIEKSQVTRLHDRNGDGEADFYENFNNDQIIAPRSHDYVTCLDTDSEGNFYFIHAKTGVMKVAADGSTLTSLADGFRNPNGMGVSPEGMVTAAPQQGGWTPESSLIVVKQGGYYGFGGPRVSEDRPAGWDLPMCFIPRAMDNSGGGQVWVQDDRWGPLSGKMLHLSYGQCRMLLALTEEVDGTMQGGTIRFPTAPDDFESGIMRGRFSPHDGQLYVSGLRGWQTRAIRDGCFQRVRYVGGEVNLPTSVKTYRNGIKLTFSEPLDGSFVQRPENYFAQQWNYLWSAAYGSPDFSVENPKEQGRDEVEVVSATLTDDGRSVFLEMPNRQPVHQLQIRWLMKSAGGKPFRGEYAHTINQEPMEAFPERGITRLSRPQFVADEVVQRLKPGLESQFVSRSSGKEDRRVMRLVALRHAAQDPVTPFLDPGAFDASLTGTLHVRLSGFYQFKVDANGPTGVRINDQLVIDAEHSDASEHPILLFKGHNRLQIDYASPADDHAELRLLWKGEDFDWEPVPSTVLFHDGGSKALQDAQQLRDGRQLFADHHCAACHRSETGEGAMFEMSLDPPVLAASGDRFDANWIRDWLLDPGSMRPGTSMPAVLGTGKQAEQDANDLAAFLASHSAGSRDNTTVGSSQPADIRAGRDLFEQQSCMTCHHFGPPAAGDDFGRTSLHFVGAKYKPGAIAAFLSNPRRYHRSTRMPEFELTASEVAQLAAFIRSASKGVVAESTVGDPVRGRALMTQKGCLNCHALGESETDGGARLPGNLALKASPDNWGCLGAEDRAGDGEAGSDTKLPRFSFSHQQRDSLRRFLATDRSSLSRSDLVETSHRLFARLQCANCHDRDGVASHRAMVVAEEGSGQLPEVIPQLNWSGEKLKSQWMGLLFSGDLASKTRPWLKAKMPAFPAYADALAKGLAAEHGVVPDADDSGAGMLFEVDDHLAEVGRTLTLQTGLDCRQCHGIGDQQPRGDENTAIAFGINFTHIRSRMRDDAYKRFMLDPPRYDPKTRMIRLSADGLTTKLQAVFDADARKQFDAVWHYIQSLPPE